MANEITDWCLHPHESAETGEVNDGCRKKQTGRKSVGGQMKIVGNETPNKTLPVDVHIPNLWPLLILFRHQQFKSILIWWVTLATRYCVWITCPAGCLWIEGHHISEVHKHGQGEKKKQPDQALMAPLIFQQCDSFVSSQKPCGRWRSKNHSQGN